MRTFPEQDQSPADDGRIAQYMVVARDELGVVESDQRKNRESHRSQRNGRMKKAARILRSKIPFLRDRWIRTLPQRGQLNIYHALRIG